LYSVSYGADIFADFSAPHFTVLPDPLAGKGRGAPGWAPRKVGTPERGREEEKGRTGGGGWGKLLPPDVRFYR